MGADMAVCNGELYGFRPLKKELEAKGYTFASESDCELILPLYREYGVEMFAKLDAEFAMIIYDAKADRLVAARDPIGIRPLFYGYLADGGILFASEAKNLVGLCERIMPFPPGHYYADGKFVRYADLTTVTEYSKDDLDTVCKKIREKLIAGVEKRLDADAPYYRPLGLDGEPKNFLKAKPQTDRSKCTGCGVCAALCPMGSISREDPAEVTGVCIKCHACVRNCPTGAKYFDDEAFLSHKAMLERDYTRRADAKIFL